MAFIKLPQPNAEEAAEGEKALVEALAVDKGVDLEGGKALIALNKLTREDNVDWHVSLIVVVGLYIVAASVLALFVTIVINKLLPTKDRYLEPDQLSDIYGFIVPLFAGFAASLGRKYLKGAENGE